MMKLFRIFTSRIIVVFIFFLIQVALLVAFIELLEDLLLYFNIISSTIGLLVYFEIVSKNVNPNHKIPWLFLIFIVPIFGVAVYAFFSRNRAGRRQRKNYIKSVEQIKTILGNNQIANTSERLSLGKYHGQSSYLYNTNHLPMFINTKTDYFAVGELFFEKLVEDLKQAEKFIFMQYFIIRPGYMWQTILDILTKKVQEGVEVRFIYDDFGSMGFLPSNYYKIMRKKGIKAVSFNRIRLLFSAANNNRDHRKITVIDGKVGYIGGANIADEYINIKQPFGYWKDSAIRFEGPAVNSLSMMFLSIYNLNQKQIEDFSQYIIKDNLKICDNGHVQPFADGPQPLYDKQISQTAYLNIINQAKKYVYITTPYLIIDYVMFISLTTAAERGVDVRIVTPGIPDKKIIYAMSKSHYLPLMAAGVKIYQYTPGFMHSKNILSDDRVAIVGTINLDYRSLVHHYECGVWMHHTTAIKEIHNDFNDIFNKSELQTEKTAKQNIIVKFGCQVLSVFETLL
jgi:cardiolipin synthase A/B